MMGWIKRKLGITHLEAEINMLKCEKGYREGYRRVWERNRAKDRESSRSESVLNKEREKRHRQEIWQLEERVGALKETQDALLNYLKLEPLEVPAAPTRLTMQEK